MGVTQWTDYTSTAYVNITIPTSTIVNTRYPVINNILPPISMRANVGASYTGYLGLAGHYREGSWTGSSQFSMTLYAGATSVLSNIWAKSNAAVGNNSYVSGSWQGGAPDMNKVFNSSNPTTKTVALTLKTAPSPYYTFMDFSNGQSVGSYGIYASSQYTLATFNVTLDAPPTYTLSSLSIDTPYIYTGLTTASVSVSNLSAKFGGSITDVTFTIGNTSVSRSDAGTLSILLDTVGTFTPTVTVTDSRGQTTTKTLDPISVNGYVAPSVSFDVERTDSTGAPEDEGTYGLIEATLTFTDVVADAVAPSVVLTDDAGTQTTPTVTWYTDDTLTTSVTWSSLSSGDTVYGIFSGLSTQHSYQVSVRPRDSEGTGTAVTQTIGAAFYTVDFLAGGHGIAFGKPASNVGFECAMDATFEETLTAQDMTQQEIDDFVDNIGGGGGGYLPSFEYVGNMSSYVFNSSWTATDDGIAIVKATWDTTGQFGYWYVSDTTDGFQICNLGGTSNGTTLSAMIPIIKGHSYVSAGSAHVDYAYFYFYKFR